MENPISINEKQNKKRKRFTWKILHMCFSIVRKTMILSSAININISSIWNRKNMCTFLSKKKKHVYLPT